MPYYTECDTNPLAQRPPNTPRFKYTIMDTVNGYARIKVTWQPDVSNRGSPGSHFYVQYK